SPLPANLAVSRTTPPFEAGARSAPSDRPALAPRRRRGVRAERSRPANCPCSFRQSLLARGRHHDRAGAATHTDSGSPANEGMGPARRSSSELGRAFFELEAGLDLGGALIEIGGAFRIPEPRDDRAEPPHRGGEVELLLMERGEE